MIQPYLFFEGRCEEAIEFYRKALGAQVEMLMRFKDAPAGEGPPGPKPPAEKIMHASLKVGDAVVMASDGMCNNKPSFSGFSLSVPAASVAQGEKLMKALSEGGQVTMPFGKTFWSPGFGMVSDRFGVSWMVNVVS